MPLTSTKFPLTLGMVVCLVVSALTVVPAQSDDLDVLKGREIRAIIGGKPGHGTDLLGRAFFAALGRVLPETTFHIQTIGGGAGAAAVKELSEAAGNLVTVSVFGNGPIYTAFTADDDLPFDVSKLKWLGSLADNNRVVSMRTALGPPVIDTLKTLGRQPITPSSSAGSPNHIESLLLNSITGLHMKVVPGFKSSQIDAMLVAGDADVRISGSRQIEALIESGDMVPVLRIGDGAYPETMRSLPLLREVARPETPKELILMLETLNRLGRPYAAAPNTDPTIVAALRLAFSIAIEDSEFRKYMAKIGMGGGSSSGGDLESAMDQLLSKENLKAVIRRYIDCGEAMSAETTTECG